MNRYVNEPGSEAGNVYGSGTLPNESFKAYPFLTGDLKKGSFRNMPPVIHATRLGTLVPLAIGQDRYAAFVPPPLPPEPPVDLGPLYPLLDSAAPDRLAGLTD